MLEDLIKEVPVTHCKVRSYYESLDKKDADLLRSYIDDEKTWSAYSLHNALRKRGIVIDYKIINKHRSGVCSCEEYYARK